MYLKVYNKHVRILLTHPNDTGWCIGFDGTSVCM